MSYINNATLSYTQTFSAVSAFNEVTGEPIFTKASTSESILVSLEQKDTKSVVSELPGKDNTRVYCEGRFTGEIYPLGIEWVRH